MIEDLDGANVEPTRRGHVFVLSAATAAVALALLAALVVPRSTDVDAPLAASPSPRGSGVTLIISSNPLLNMRLDLSRTVVCADGTRLEPPYFISVDESNRQMFASGASAGTDRSVRVALRPPSLPSPARWDDRAGWSTVICATPDVDAPLE